MCKLPNETNEYVACIQLVVVKSTLELKHFFFLGYNHAGIHVDYFQRTFFSSFFFPLFFGTVKFGHLPRGGLILKLLVYIFYIYNLFSIIFGFEPNQGS